MAHDICLLTYVESSLRPSDFQIKDTLCVCVCTHVCVYVCIHACICVFICAHPHVCFKSAQDILHYNSLLQMEVGRRGVCFLPSFPFLITSYFISNSQYIITLKLPYFMGFFPHFLSCQRSEFFNNGDVSEEL